MIDVDNPETVKGKETPVALLSGIDTALDGVLMNFLAGLMLNVEDPPGQTLVGDAVGAVTVALPSSKITVGKEVAVILVRGVLEHPVAASKVATYYVVVEVEVSAGVV